VTVVVDEGGESYHHATFPSTNIRHVMSSLATVLWACVALHLATRTSAGFSLEQFELLGAAERTDTGGVRLTHDEYGDAAGGLFAKSSVGSEWEFQVLLNAHGRKNSGGNGFAFWYVADPLHVGNLMGGPDTFYGFMLMLSTVPDAKDKNKKHGDTMGWVGGFFNDGGAFDTLELTHGRSRRNSCRAGFRNHVLHDRGPTLLRISYDGSSLTVRISEPQEASFRECFVLHDIELPPGYYYGITASTTETHADFHDVYALEELELPDSLADASSESQSVHEQPTTTPLANNNIKAEEQHNANLEFLVSQSDVVVALASQHQEFAQRLKEAEDAHERELKSLQAHIDILIAKLSLAEQETQRTLAELEGLVRSQIDAFTDDHRSYRQQWLVPFLLLSFAIVVLAGVLRNRYLHLVKQHLL